VNASNTFGIFVRNVDLSSSQIRSLTISVNGMGDIVIDNNGGLTLTERQLLNLSAEGIDQINCDSVIAGQQCDTTKVVRGFSGVIVGGVVSAASRSRGIGANSCPLGEVVFLDNREMNITAQSGTVCIYTFWGGRVAHFGTINSNSADLHIAVAKYRDATSTVRLT